MRYIALTLPDGKVVKGPEGIQTTGDILGNIPQFAVTIIFLLTTFFAIAFIIYSGILWITSGGDSKQIEGARRRLTYAILGLVITFLSFLIVEIAIQLSGGNPNLFNLGWKRGTGVQMRMDESFESGAPESAQRRRQGAELNTNIPNPNCTLLKRITGQCK